MLEKTNYETQLSRLIKSYDDSHETEEAAQKWEEEWEQFVFADCDDSQAKSALDLLTLHLQNKYNV